MYLFKFFLEVVMSDILQLDYYTKLKRMSIFELTVEFAQMENELDLLHHDIDTITIRLDIAVKHQKGWKGFIHKWYIVTFLPELKAVNLNRQFEKVSIRRNEVVQKMDAIRHELGKRM